MTLPLRWHNWSDLETQARSPLLWNTFQKKWIERDLSHHFRGAMQFKYKRIGTNLAASGNWVAHADMDMEIYLPLNHDWVWVYTSGEGVIMPTEFSAAQVRMEIVPGSANYIGPTNLTLLSTAQPAILQGDITAFVSLQTRVVVRPWFLFTKLGGGGGSIDYDVFISHIATRLFTDDLN